MVNDVLKFLVSEEEDRSKKILRQHNTQRMVLIVLQKESQTKQIKNIYTNKLNRNADRMVIPITHH